MTTVRLFGSLNAPGFQSYSRPARPTRSSITKISEIPLMVPPLIDCTRGGIACSLSVVLQVCLLDTKVSNGRERIKATEMHVIAWHELHPFIRLYSCIHLF